MYIYIYIYIYVYIYICIYIYVYTYMGFLKMEDPKNRGFLYQNALMTWMIFCWVPPWKFLHGQDRQRARERCRLAGRGEVFSRLQLR